MLSLLLCIKVDYTLVVVDTTDGFKGSQHCNQWRAALGTAVYGLPDETRTKKIRNANKKGAATGRGKDMEEDRTGSMRQVAYRSLWHHTKINR